MLVLEVSQPKSEWTLKAHIWMQNGMSNEMINMEVIHMTWAFAWYKFWFWKTIQLQFYKKISE